MSSDASVAAPATPQEGRVPWTSTQKLTLLATSLGLFMIFMDALIVNVALPDIQAAFDTGESGLQWVVTAYSVGMAVFMMTSASLSDVNGRRRLYVGGLVVFAAMSALSGLAPNVAVLTGARAVQGLSAATVNVTSLALVSSAFPDRGERTKAIGVWTAIASVAIASGPTVGGFLTESVGWRAVFWVNVPIAMASILLTLRFVAESKDPRDRRFDYVGQVLFIVAIGSLAYAVIEGQDAGWVSPEIVTLFVVGLATITAFGLYEYRATDPMMDVRLFGIRIYTLAIVNVFFALFCAYGMLLVVTQYLQNVRDYSPIDAGLALLPFALALLFISPVAGVIADKVGSRLPVLTGQTSLTVGLGLLAVGLSVDIVLVLVGLGLVGLGAALLMTPMTALAMSSVDPDRAGMASGILSSQRAIGSTAGYTVLGAVLAIWLSASLEDSLADAVPDATERSAVAEDIIDQANPHAYNAELAPGKPLDTSTPAQREEILEAADGDFVTGIQIALGLAAGIAAVVLGANAVLFAGERTDEDGSGSARAAPAVPER